MDNPLLRDCCYIAGAWICARSNDTFAVQDPATGEEIARLPDCGAAETDAAISAAAEAFPGWKALSADERCDKLRRVHDLMLERIEPLAELMVYENGKPLAEARAEVRYSASFVRWFAEEGRRAYGEIVPAAADKRVLVTREPVGVCALITPWNFPSAMLTRKLAPALAAGCTVVAKPAAETPLSALALAALCEEAGIPAGVVNVLTGTDAEGIGQALCASPAVRKLSFTGSTEVGRILMRQCAPTLKRLSLELGGNAPFLVFEDADLDAAAAGAMASKYRNGGQTCVATNRFLVHASVAEEFTALVVAKSQALKVGHGLEPGVEVGPLISAEGRDKVRRLVQDALDRGASAALGGVPGGEGLFAPPTVLTRVTREMALWREEIFGPVIPITTFETEEEALALANDTEYGLAAYVYTRDLARSWRVREGLEYGMIGLNTGMISMAQAPFGGIKQSGLGREGSRHGLDEYLQLKYVCVGL